MKCGLLGQRLGHSYSPQIHAHLGDYSYVLFEKEPQELEDFLRNGDFTGLNVTMPYKKTVIPYLDEVSDTARKLGAVNTIVRRNGKLIGHNTDYFGFQSMLQTSGLSPAGKKCLVLGSGGASSVAATVLSELGAQVVIISRQGDNNYDNLDRHQDASILVNATPVGMYPNVGAAPVELDRFPALEGVLDVVYNPARTHLLLEAERRQIPCMNGLWMLVAQACEASGAFTGSPVPYDKIRHVYSILRHQMENIVLIGMPGCGKSTVGYLLAQQCGKTYADVDVLIEELAGKTIPQIFAEDGEAAFRDWESKALAQLGKQSGLVIATGGGCVTQPRNYPLLHQNGIIFWLQRSIEKLPTDGRPLSHDLEHMYGVRKPMYKAFSDLIIDNNGAIANTIDQILSNS